MKIVVAYSGGLDTSVLLTWLKETYRADVIAYCADVGQGDELDGLEEKALNTGASKCFIGDMREEFARDFIFPMFQANAVYEGRYLLGTSIARPCIAKGMLEIALQEGADAIAHGATGKGNDQVRFELSAASLAPQVEVIAPWRQERFREQFPGRSEMIAYAEAHDIPIQASLKKPYSMDRNLLHISFEAGMLEDPWYDGTTEADRDMYVLSVSPEEAPDQPHYLQLLFEKGNAIGFQCEGQDDLLAGLEDITAEALHPAVRRSVVSGTGVHENAVPHPLGLPGTLLALVVDVRLASLYELGWVGLVSGGVVQVATAEEKVLSRALALGLGGAVAVPTRATARAGGTLEPL